MASNPVEAKTSKKRPRKVKEKTTREIVHPAGEWDPERHASVYTGDPHPDSPDLTFDGQPRCTATSRQTGYRCRRAATPGHEVCRNHGSGSPQAQAAAYLRLANLVDPMIGVLENIARDKDAANTDRRQAADSLLDRAGIGRRSVVDDTSARTLLVQRLLELANTPEEEPDPTDGDDYEVNGHTTLVGEIEESHD